MGFGVGAELRGFKVEKIKELYDQEAIGPAVKMTAREMAKLARLNFRRMSKHTGTGELLRDIRARRSNFSEIDWLYGAFGKSSGKWEETTGGRAHFSEYGRSAPGKGKGKGGPQPVGQRPQQPRPFMRQTINRGKKELYGLSGKEVAKVTKKIRRLSQKGVLAQPLIKRIKSA